MRRLFSTLALILLLATAWTWAGPRLILDPNPVKSGLPLTVHGLEFCEGAQCSPVTILLDDVEVAVKIPEGAGGNFSAEIQALAGPGLHVVRAAQADENTGEIFESSADLVVGVGEREPGPAEPQGPVLTGAPEAAGQARVRGEDRRPRRGRTSQRTRGPELAIMSLSADEYPFAPDLKYGGRSVAVTISPASSLAAIEAAEGGGLYRSVDGGASWSRISSFPMFRMEDVAYDPEDASVVIASTRHDGRTASRGGIWQSSDGGSSWSRSPVTYGCTSRPNSWGIGTAAGSDVHQKIFVANDCGVAYTGDSGSSWSNIDPTGGPGTRFFDVVSVRTGADTVTAYACGGAGVYRTTVTGSATPSWTQVSSGYPLSDRRCMMAFSPFDVNTVFLTIRSCPATGSCTGQWGMRIFESGDGGATWTDLGGPRSSNRPGLVAARPATGAGPSDFDLYWGNGVVIYRQRCTDDGDPNTLDCPVGADTNCADSADDDGDGIVNEGCPAGGPDTDGNGRPDPESNGSTPSQCKNAVDDDGDGLVNDGCPVMERFDNGTHPDPANITFDPATGCPALISNDGGIGRSTDCGLNWTDSNAGRHALQIYNAWGTVRGPGATDTDIYFGTQDNDWWYSLDNGATWTDPGCCEGFRGQADRRVPPGGLADVRMTYRNGAPFYNFLSPRGFSSFNATFADPPGGNAGGPPTMFGNQRFAMINQDRQCPPSFRLYILQPETGGECANAADDDADGAVNDGCPANGIAESGTACHNAADDDGDGDVNDGCSHFFSAESGTECANAADDDGDGVVNDGCPRGGPDTDGDGRPDPEPVASNCNAAAPGQCLDAVDDDGDGLVNDGCPHVGVWGPMGPSFSMAWKSPLVASGPAASPTFYFAVDTGGRDYELRRMSGPMDASATLSDASGAPGSRLEDIGAFCGAGGTWYCPVVFEVNPSDPMHLIGADDFSQEMKVSIDGGGTWTADADLTDLVTVNGAFEWNAFGGVQPWSVAWDPENTLRTVVGTEQAGIVATVDGGLNWFTLPGTTDRIPFVNSFFFDQDHNLVYASTYGRSLWSFALDDLPPVAKCADVTVNTDPGICSAGADIDDGSFDPDGGALSYSQSPPGPYPLGDTLVTLTVTDPNGDSDSCQATVTVVDNEDPVVTCPMDTSVECSAPGGTPATDPNLAPFFAGVSATDNCDPSPDITNDAPAFFPLGDTVVTFSAEDASGNMGSCMATVSVVDTTPPEISVEVAPHRLWPPRHKLVEVTATVTVTDVCDPNPAVTLVSITSNEPDDGIGDGSTTGDIQDAAFGTDDRVFSLRAERAGGRQGRIYTIVYSATDCSGNVAAASATVTVPHDRRR